MHIFLKLFTVNPSNCSQKIYHKSLSVRSCVRYIIVSTNSTSLSFVALSASIPYPYLLAIAAYSFSISAMVISIRVGVMSSTIGSGYFAPYYPITNHPRFQLQLYVDSAAIVLCFSCNGISSSASPTALLLAFCHPLHIYIEALVLYQIDRVLILDCQCLDPYFICSFLFWD